MSRLLALRRPAARRVAGLVAVFLALSVGSAGLAAPARADGANHAAVIIETGAEVHRVVISFAEDSISGIEALQRVPGANPAVAGFAGLGAGVCGLFGVGHPATVNECMGVPGDPRAWLYWHVPAGRTGFDDATFSRAGAGSVRVHDGDTEGWRFGGGEPPTWVQLAFPEPPPPAATASPTGLAAPPPLAPGAPTVGGGGGGGSTAPGARASATTLPPSSTSSSNPSGSAASGAGAGGSGAGSSTGRAKDGKTEVDAARASASRPGDEGSGGGSVLSLVGFAVVLAVLAAGIYLARRARVGSRPAGP